MPSDYEVTSTSTEVIGSTLPGIELPTFRKGSLHPTDTIQQLCPAFPAADLPLPRVGMNDNYNVYLNPSKKTPTASNRN